MHGGVLSMGAGLLGAGRCFGSRKHKYQGYVRSRRDLKESGIDLEGLEAWRVGGLEARKAKKLERRERLRRRGRLGSQEASEARRLRG